MIIMAASSYQRKLSYVRPAFFLFMLRGLIKQCNFEHKSYDNPHMTIIYVEQLIWIVYFKANSRLTNTQLIQNRILQFIYFGTLFFPFINKEDYP
jgi:hypothetical protein